MAVYVRILGGKMTILYILVIAFSSPMNCPDRQIDVQEQRCAAEKPEVLFYSSKESVINDYSVMPTRADSARIYQLNIKWLGKPRFEVSKLELRPKKSYEVFTTTTSVYVWP
jgi:hypothetical protein